VHCLSQTCSLHDTSFLALHVLVSAVREGPVHTCVQVHVYDLAENKHDALCQQKVVKKAKLTKISFNPKHPILIVGNDRCSTPANVMQGCNLHAD